VAATSQSRAQGLMHRKAMDSQRGMLFVFPDAAPHCFWMKNTLIPLSIAFIDDDGTIANIVDMKPHDESSHCPVRAVRYALEMELGWFDKRGLKAGTRLGAPRLFKGDEPLQQFLYMSSFAEYMLVHEHGVVKIRKDMPLDRAALIGCAVTTGANDQWGTRLAGTANFREGIAAFFSKRQPNWQ
jgi:uncharacterized membrane protein (UPF0127 family)